MIKKTIIALVTLSLFSTAYFADEKKEPNESESSKSDENYGKKHSEEVNKGKQGEKMRKEHANKHAHNPGDSKQQSGHSKNK
ncbi:MAG: hypothetical protein OEV78_03635 [Spirochaetia bacterium]|nr:hypothetical protein [Spirochaetia bacterium]